MTIGIFGLSVSDLITITISATALLLTAFTFYIGHTRNKKSEQIRISREIWSRIEPQKEIFEKMSMEDLSISADNRRTLIKTMNSLRNELDDLVYLVDQGEIKGTIITEHYRRRLLPIYQTAKFIDKKYPDTKEHSGTAEILGLIKKYDEITQKKGIRERIRKPRDCISYLNKSLSRRRIIQGLNSIS